MVRASKQMEQVATKADLAALGNDLTEKIDRLAQSTQEQFQIVAQEMTAVRLEISSSASDLKSAITSSRESMMEDIKKFLDPHLRSLDTVLVDVEQLKQHVWRGH